MFLMSFVNMHYRGFAVLQIQMIDIYVIAGERRHSMTFWKPQSRLVV